MKKSKGEKLFSFCVYFLLTLTGFIMIFPFYVTVIKSISPSIDFGTKVINLWPSKLDFSAFKAITGQGSGLIEAYAVTTWSTVVGTALNMFFTTLAAIALANKNLPYRKGITFFIVVTMYFGGGMIPTYLLVKNVGLINSLWVLVIPNLVYAAYVLYLRNFIMTIPVEILEAAKIDGLSDIGMIRIIILPLSGAAIATFSLFYAVGHWNDFYSGALYILDPNKYPLQVYLKEILQDTSAMRLNPDELRKLYESGNPPPPSEALKAANIIAATLPIVCVYPFLQKYFVKGMTMGSVKG